MSTPHDPAIIDSSIISMDSSRSSSRTPRTQDKPSVSRGTSYSNGLEPGSALSKLLDSAMANAAKESTPEPETARSPSSIASPRRESLSDFKPVPSSKANVYSIEELLVLRSTPEVAAFDTSVLPDQAFWVIKPVRNQKTSEKSGTSRRNNRRNQNSNDGKWERKPTGFAKSSELDRIRDPEWDNPGASDLQMDMGSTVEDFERWKQRMHENDRKQFVDETPTEPEAPKGNEVDNFFSFVNPRTGSSAPETSTPGSDSGKSSRFSSFFGGPGPQESPKRSGPPPGLARNPAGKPDPSAGSRFFGLAQGSPAQQHATPKQEPVAHQSQVPHVPSPMAGQGMPMAGPPGLTPPNLGGDSKAQDSFFLSLLNKRDQDKGSDQQQGAKPDAKPDASRPRQGQQGPPGPHNLPHGIPLGWLKRGPQQMYQFQGPPPPGMFPPGMGPPPPGFPMQGRPPQDGQPNQQGMPRGQMPPPGFYGFPPEWGSAVPECLHSNNININLKHSSIIINSSSNSSNINNYSNPNSSGIRATAVACKYIAIEDPLNTKRRNLH
ncbi:uncharacterized protein CXQ87_004160 [Candidozyma duobushaemuli]|uniref:Uncharacterized protein n=1 Tax=Candidozyma duobushaemuli TaxID=1231522 RepID=A0A2V1AED4_9ASCO|nr:uncharacterized protein CXQ87_004160 [[Candida] duobushaemulonis]PVH16288.1 hypothetical protein CXQ87_004160 [[Candida] duobushaemulonis]